MANRTLNVLLTANSASLRSQLAMGAREVESFGNKVQATGEKSSTALNKIGLAAKSGTAVLALALGYAAKTALDFEANMRNVNSISGLSESGLKSLSGEVIKLGAAFPQGTNDLAKGLYDIASSGFQGAEGITVLAASAKAAAAGLADTATSARAITSVLNAYGLSAGDARDVSDTLFQTVNLGVVSFSELAGVIGDVVGTAAAAGVKIDEVGAAIATMTLSGISASEAGTSLNRVIQSLIQPSDELALLMSQLGLNMERDLADPAIGLHGVMEKLRVATGGNVTALLTLFPEIRAARGAFALMANEGETLRRVYTGIGTATEGVGATQKAFAEQMKSTKAELQAFMGAVEATAINVGLHLLPMVSGLLVGLDRLGGQALPAVRAGLSALAPYFQNMREVGINLIDIVKALLENLAPVGKVIAGIVAVGVISFLNTFAGVLAEVTDFLAKHEGAVSAVVAAYLAFKIAAAIGAVLQATGAALQFVVWRMSALSVATSTTAASMGALKFAALGVGSLAVLLGLAATIQGFSHARDGADKLYQSLVKDIDLSSYDGLRKALDEIGQAQMDLESNSKVQGGFANAFRGAVELITPMKNSVQDAREEVSKLNAEAEKLAQRKVNVYTNLNTVMEQTGQTRQSVEALAKTLGVDLTESFDKSGPAREQLVEGFHRLAKDALGGGAAVKRAGTESIEALTAMAAATNDAMEKTGKAFAGATDFVKGFTADVAKEKGLKTFLEETTKAAEDFAQGIETATKKGLDPKIIQRLLEAGPEAAAPMLQAIAADHSGNLVRLANETEKALGTINAKVVAFARLTATAINDTKSDQKVKDLGAAMAITAAQFDSAGNITKQAIADKIGIPLSEVDRIAQSFGITVGALAEPVKGAASATDGFAEKLRSLNGALERNGPYIGSYTEGGRENERMLKDVQTEINNHINRLDAQGATMDEKRAAFNRHVEDLRSVLRAAGLSKDEIDKLVASLQSMEGTYTAKIDVNTSAANASLDQLQGRLNELNTEISQSGPGGGRGAERNDVQGRIDQGGGNSPATEPTDYGVYGDAHEANAQGSVLRFYADGGENHVAQIAPKGTTRVWNEEETDGEAYIPYAVAKRGRSTRILAKVADDFGLALTKKLARGGVVQFSEGGRYVTEINAYGQQEDIYQPPGWTPEIGAANIAAARGAVAASRVGARSVMASSAGQNGCEVDWNRVGDIINRAIAGAVNLEATFNVDGREWARQTAKGLNNMARGRVG